MTHEELEAILTFPEHDEVAKVQVLNIIRNWATEEYKEGYSEGYDRAKELYERKEVG